MNDSIVPRPNAGIDDALGTPKAWRQTGNPTFEALIERWQAKANVFSSSDRAHTVFNVCADELAALAPHYISKDKVRELRDELEKMGNEVSGTVDVRSVVRRLTAMLEEAE